MKIKALLVVLGILLASFGGLAIGQFAFVPIIQKYVSHPASTPQKSEASISATSILPAAPIMLATPDGDEATDHQFGLVNGIAFGSAGDATLQTQVWNLILQIENKQGCSDVVSDDVDITQQLDTSGTWIEEWTVKACGNMRVFKVKFTSNPTGGTNIEING